MKASIVASLKASHRLDTLLSIAGLARSTYFYHQAHQPDPAKNLELKERIKTLCASAKHRYGHRRIHLLLRREGMQVAKKTVLALIRQLGLTCKVRRRRYNSYPGEEGATAPHLLRREFTAAAPTQKWVTDVTEFAVAGTKVYYSPIIDLYDHGVIGRSIDVRATTAFTNASLRQALQQLPAEAAGPLVHTDQGFQYRHHSWRALLAQHGASQSMSRKANCWDNAIAQNYFGHIKAEAFLEERPKTVEELTAAIETYEFWYNHERIQERLQGLTPMEYRSQALESQAALTLS